MDCTLPATLSWTLGLALAIGTFLSYVPQEVKIVMTKSSAGISPLYLCLALVFSYGSLTTSLLSNWGSFSCCGELNFWECNELLMDVWQIVVMPLSTTTIEILFLVYFKVLPPDGMVAESEEFVEFEKKQRTIAYRFAYWFCVLLFTNCWICAMLLVGWGYWSTPVTLYAEFVSFVIFFTTLLQLWPQIYRTYKQKTAGSISLLTQAIQCPGNLLVVIFQASAGNSWYVWMPFLNAGVQQLILCLLIVWYDYMPCYKTQREARKAALVSESEKDLTGDLDPASDSVDESSALLRKKQDSINSDLGLP
mmetsp:Transcript_19349/g.74303  ORF Transcript_19349/g.74303 Transcript_19349/m.74303 type:complete len:307 (-) Transcript_19349:44-964(-)